MFKNYLLILLRNFKRNKFFTLINVLGLTLGITCSLIIFLIVKEELSFNNYHEKADLIYRVGHIDIVDGREYTGGGVPLPMKEAVDQDIVGLNNSTLVMHRRYGLISVGQPDGSIDYYEEDPEVVFIDPSFFEMFTWPLIEGSLDKLGEPNVVVLNEELAKKYFEKESAIGRTIRFNKQNDLQVIAVVENAPKNSDLPFGIFISQETLKSNGENFTRWNSIASDNVLFVELAPGTEPENVDAQWPELITKYWNEEFNEERSFVVDPFTDYHFNEDYGTFSQRSVSIQLLWTYTAIGLFLIITACFNFINMSTAMAVKRSKEVGMRKVLGSSRKQLVLRFLGETFFITLISVIFSIGITERLLPWVINDYFDLSIELRLFSDMALLSYLLGTLLLVSFLAGFYPALVLSSAKPVNALKGNLSSQNNKMSLRRALVVFQFFLCQLLIFGTVVAVKQFNFFNSVDMGYDKDDIMTFDLRENSADVQKRWEARLENISGVEEYSIASRPPFSGSISATNTFFDISDSNRVEINTYIKMADANYMDTYGLRLVAGSWLADSDTIRDVVVNESFLKKIGISEPLDALGETIILWGRRLPIVGVIQDFHAITLNQQIEPTAIFSDSRRYNTIGLRINGQNTSNVISEVEELWSEFHPEYEFDHIFVDENIRNYYETEERMSQMLTTFAGIAIFIGCLGLYGLVAFMANQKSKELGIRKVLGASVEGLVSRFSLEFVKLVGIAFLIAAPLGYFGMNTWLDEYAYSISIGVATFIISFIASLLIALFTTGYRSYKAASINPVNSLRNE